ncbi:hypothetical protein BH11BAC2_BH11BAC2_16300 [soil metagenome]
MKKLLIIIALFAFQKATAQEGLPLLKSPIHNPSVLAMIYVPINPNDTAFQKTDFHLPVKCFPFFKMNANTPIYTRAKMDSVITYLQGLFKD